MTRSERTKELWKNPEYRERLVKAHKGHKPSNLEQLAEISRTRIRAKGTTPWNKGKKCDYQRGEKHYAWKGGMGTERHRLMGNFEYINWRNEVFERDDYTCQKCNKKGIYIMAHHIKPWSEFRELRYDINNGITLCKECHAKVDKFFAKFYKKEESK